MKPFGCLAPIGPLKSVSKSLYFWARNHEVRFWRGLYLAKYASFGVFCWLWAWWVILHVFNFMQLSNAIMLVVVQICCTFFLVLFRSVGPFLHFCTGFCIQILCLHNWPILGNTCLTKREASLLACLFIYLAGFAYLFESFNSYINFLSFFNLLQLFVFVTGVLWPQELPP